MSIPESLKPWVAFKPEHKPTQIINPCYVDFRLQDALADWHPAHLQTNQYHFMHVADPGGGEFAVVTSISGKWSLGMMNAMKALKLRPAQLDGHDILLDDAIKDSNVVMGEWQITRWLVAKGVDSNLTPVHHDFITWTSTKTGKSLDSMFSWEPYKE